MEVLEVTEGATVSSLFESIFGETELAELPVLYALEQVYVDGTEPIPDGAEVAFLPPLGGG